MKKIIKDNKIIILILTALSIIGIFTYKDYTINIDDVPQINHALLNYKEYLSLFSGSNRPINSNYYKLLKKFNMIGGKIDNYKYKYYGVAIQMPTMIVLTLTNYKMSVSSIYFMRHLYVFIIYIISLAYFYLMLDKYIFKNNKKYAIIGTIFLILSPKIYGDAFHNIKDLVFMSLGIINIYYAFKYIEKDNLKNIISLSIISALSINCRVVGGIILLFTMIYKLIKDRKDIKNTLCSILKLFFISYLFYIIMTPASWSNVLTFPFECIDFFYNYKDPYATVGSFNTCYYFGKTLISTSLPWHYVLVWIFITTPILYTIFVVLNVFSLIKKKIKKINSNVLLINSILIFMLLFVCILRPTLYSGWRHLYFLYPLIIVNVTEGYKYLDEKIKNKIVLLLVLCINSTVIIGWMIINHPYQNLYFNLAVSKYAYKNFEVAYWNADYEAIKYIVDHDRSKSISIYIDDGSEYKIRYKSDSVYLLPNKDAQRIRFSKYRDKQKYIIDMSNKLGVNKNYSKDYKKICERKLSGNSIFAIYKRK